MDFRLIFPKILMSTGVLLLLISVGGTLTSIGKFRGLEPRAWEQYDEALVSKVTSLGKLKDTIESRINSNASKQMIMRELFDVISARFTHSPPRQHTLYSNWILYFAKFVSPAFSKVRTPAAMLRKGRSLACGQISYLLLTAAHQFGIKTRHVALGGHIVMEAWYDSRWHMYDPDWEVIPVNSKGDILSVSELSRNSELLNSLYIPRVAKKIKTMENNSFVSYPQGAWAEWKNTALWHVERKIEIAKYVVPILLIILGFYAHRKNKIKKLSVVAESRYNFGLSLTRKNKG